ncbi:MAG TPA: 16S rRNA (cytidine(1402)-2'-O)-methyltransferase [Steroidobacteraceae bacterium]
MARGARLACAGRLEVVATPIGNLGDLSTRAREVLASADLIAAEDTRRSAQLLAAIGVTARLISLHDYNEQARLDSLVRQLTDGKIIALVSDAGTPLLSDPGFALVRAAAAAGIEVRSVPGASAVTAALSIAGLPTDRFAFEGFLPPRASARRALLARLAGEPRTLVLFEAPHRIAATLDDLSQLFGVDRSAVVTRELTKLHESVYRGTLGQLAAMAHSQPELRRGEITLVVAGAAPAAAAAGDAELLARTLRLLLGEMPPARAAAIAAQIAGARRSDAYALALQLQRR